MQTTVADYRGWCGHRAWQLLGSGIEYRHSLGMDSDDLAQIGMIAMWQAEQTFDPSKGSLPAWLTFKATCAMKDALTKREKHVTWSGDRPDDWDEEVGLAAPDLLELVEQAYHRGEIRAALSKLTPRQREYVVLRFWGQATGAELVEHFGYEPSSLWTSKKNGAKIKLAAELKSLTLDD